MLLLVSPHGCFTPFEAPRPLLGPDNELLLIQVISVASVVTYTTRARISDTDAGCYAGNFQRTLFTGK